MESSRGLSLPIPSLRVQLSARLSAQGLAGVRAWIPQPGSAQALDAIPDLAGSPEHVVVSGHEEAGRIAPFLDEVQAHWETALAAHARRLAVAQAVHGLSNALTPLLCAETADSLTVEEQARVSWRSDTLRHLARGAETPSACTAGPFLQNLRRALEHAGVELELESPEALGQRPIAPDHGALRDRLLEAALAAHQGRGVGPAPTLRLREREGGLSLELEAAAGTLFSRRGRELVEVERRDDLVRLTWVLPRPWLAWLGPAPGSSEALSALGVGLLVVPDIDAWEASLAARPSDFADRPLGVALGGPRSQHSLLKREVLSRDLGLGRACYSAARWPPCEIPEVVDVSSWCRSEAE